VQRAEALGPTLPLPTLPLPTVTVPGVTTIDMPTTISTPATTEVTTTVTTAVTTTVAAPAPTPGGSPPATSATTAQTYHPPAAPAPVAGVRHLASGAVSIPVSSVRAPTRLRLLVSFAPHVFRQKGQRIAVALRVVDTRGYVVRGARIVVGTSFAAHGATARVGTKLSATDGLARFTVPVRLPANRPQQVVLVIRAVDPVAPAAAGALLRVRIPVRLPR